MPSALHFFARGDPPARAVSRAARPGCGASEAAASLEELRARQRGMTPTLAALVDTPGVTDILINGGRAWVERGSGLVRADVGINSEAEARRCAIRMASACGVRLDDARPIADGTLPGGVRVHAVLAPISGSGTLLSLRVLGTRRLGVADLEARGTLSPPVGALVRALIAARANVLVSGATGSGKTTLLSAALTLVPDSERIVCIEENSICGGASGAVLECLAQHGVVKPVLPIGIPDTVTDHGDPALLLDKLGLSAEKIRERIANWQEAV